MTSGISDSVHYPPSIHSRVLLGSSCHADTVLPDDHSNPRPLSSNNVRTLSKSWFHVYSQEKANCSRRTQCAASAHLPDIDISSICPISVHRARSPDDLIKKSCKHSPPTVRIHPLGNGLRFDELIVTSGISDSVHYPPSIHSRVLLGSSCHADTVLPDDHSNPRPLSSNNVRTLSKSWFHVYSQEKANCSRRTQCAAAAHLPDLVSGPICHRRSRRAKKKLRKQHRLLKEVRPPSDQVIFSKDDIKNDIIVFDGGNSSCPMISPPKRVTWRRHHVSDLYIQDNLRGDIGLTFRRIDGCLPFIRLPRNTSLDIIGQCGLSKVYNALQACESLRTPLCRSNNKRVFTDFEKPPRYVCVGPQVSRNSPKVHDHPSFMDKLPRHHWESLLWLMRRAEESFKTIADHQVISHIHHAKDAVPFKTFSTSNHKSNSAKFFGGIAFGTNVFLRCHTDQDFTMSISQVFVKGKSRYLLNDDIIVFFCFPTLGVAVPLRPGDYLLFNPLIPHCISSRCKYEDDIMCVSMYLKTAIVGLNDNSLPLTPLQGKLADRFVKYKLL